MAPAPDAAPDPMLGAAVGSFRVRRLLGRGGMGAVYLGEHPVIGSKVAIKFLHESLAGNAELVGRFYDEARAVNLIGHENIVAIYDLAVLPPSRYYIVMEHLEGRTLAAHIAAGGLPEAQTLHVLAQLTDALGAAHERGVIHRDLKPENVFLVRRHEDALFVKLVDFGIAKLGGHTHSGHTAAGMIVGTPEYMAPEQCDNRPIDARTDVYALGVMAYEAATGRLPFSGAGLAQVLLAQLRQKPQPPRQLAPDLSPAFEQIILRALEKEPENRYPDMRAMGQALRAARDAARSGGAAPTGKADADQVAPPARPQPPAVTVEVRSGGAARRLPVGDLSRGGLFLCCDGEMPPVLSKVTVILPRGERMLAVAGEVVRHVSPAQADAWRMKPGFAVQLEALGPEERLAFDALDPRLRSPTPAPTPERLSLDGETAFRLLESLERRAAAGHYELLDLPPEAGLPEAREKAHGLRRQVEDLRSRLPPAAQVTRIAALVARIEQAAHVLGKPAERLMHDARRGNFRGVARCVTAGVPLPLVASRRRSMMAENPAHEAESQRRLARARVAAKLGNEETALAELESALRADPLNLELHELHAELESKIRLRRVVG